jgi:hypothetical protein
LAKSVFACQRIRADNSANPYFSANTSTYMAIYASSNTANNSHTSGNARANSRSNINANADQCGYANYDSHDEHNSRRIQVEDRGYIFSTCRWIHRVHLAFAPTLILLRPMQPSAKL